MGMTSQSSAEDPKLQVKLTGPLREWAVILQMGSSSVRFQKWAKRGLGTSHAPGTQPGLTEQDPPELHFLKPGLRTICFQPS